MTPAAFLRRPDCITTKPSTSSSNKPASGNEKDGTLATVCRYVSLMTDRLFPIISASWLPDNALNEPGMVLLAAMSAGCFFSLKEADGALSVVLILIIGTAALAMPAIPRMSAAKSSCNLFIWQAFYWVLRACQLGWMATGLRRC
jgi:hypothetical protein